MTIVLTPKHDLPRCVLCSAPKTRVIYITDVRLCERCHALDQLVRAFPNVARAAVQDVELTRRVLERIDAEKAGK